jgi:Uma2 family endonuclease
MSPGGFRHSKVTGRAFFLLEVPNQAHHLGHVLTGEAGFIVRREPDTVREADVAFISYKRLPQDARVSGFLEQAPELVIEVLSDDKSWTETEEKIDEYHAAGVDLVWVLDPRTLTLRAYGRGASPVLLHGSDAASADPLVPGFSCRVADFFADWSPDGKGCIVANTSDAVEYGPILLIHWGLLLGERVPVQPCGTRLDLQDGVAAAPW